MKNLYTCIGTLCKPELYYVHVVTFREESLCVYGDQDSYTKPMYTKLKAGESSMLAEVPSAGAVWSVDL